MIEKPAKILLVDDQPGKLLSYKAVLDELGETLLTAGSAREAFQVLLKNDVAVVLIDVCMPDTDGFELAAMIRDHPRFERTALIFISAIVFDDVDRLRGYEMGAVDYVAVPVIPEVLRAKVKVFVELYRKTQQLEQLNRNLEARVAERTAALAASSIQLRQAEQARSLALAAGQMGSWEWDAASGRISWDPGQCAIFGVDHATFVPTVESLQALVHPDDLARLLSALSEMSAESKTFQTEFRVIRPGGEVRWCIGAAAAGFDANAVLVRISGVTIDITDRKKDEQRQMLLAEEVDHRARNVVAVIQAIMRLTRAPTIEDYISTLDGRVKALSTAHKLLAKSRWEGADLRRLADEELAPYQGSDGRIKITGRDIMLPPATAQTIALALHELVTNAAKYGALSRAEGHIDVQWAVEAGEMELVWSEGGGPKVNTPKRGGYGTRVITGGIEGQLGGRTRFEWRAEGLRCTLLIPFAVDGKPHGSGESRQVAKLPPAGMEPDSRQGVLLVEDEPLISIMLADLLSESGHVVDGPYNTFGEALAAATNNDLYAGILDVNLHGEAVYPIAEVLSSRNIPFLFITGYGASSIDMRFHDVPVLQKPVELQKLRTTLANLSR